MLTDDRIPFADNHQVEEEAEAKAAACWAERDEPRIYRWHSFDWACEQTKIERRLTKPRCPRTDGRVERMSRTSRTPRSSATIIPAPANPGCTCSCS